MGGGGGSYGASAGMAGTGAILGGIGDIIQAANYKQPHLPAPSDTERRLRRLAQSQLLGGGQELLGGTALYNQMAPILMGQLPGMHYVPGQGGSDGGMGGGAGSGSGQQLGSYQDSVNALQQSQQQQARLAQMNAQIKGMKKGPEKKAAVQERKALKKETKNAVPQWRLEQQTYQAGARPPTFDIRQAPPASAGSSLGDINALLGNLGNHQSLLAAYQAGRS